MLRPATLCVLGLWLSALRPPLSAAEPQARIAAPEAVAPGDLVVLDASTSLAESYAWRLVGSDKTYLPIDNGQRVVFATGTPGRYTFVLAVGALNQGVGMVDLAVREIVVGDVPPPGPTPPPGPQPPNPTPLPDGKFQIAAKAQQWASIVNRPAEAAGLSAAFEGVVAQIAAGTLGGPVAIMQAVRTQTATVLPAESRPLWEPFTAPLADELGKLYAAGRLKTNDDWATCFREIALGLKG